MDHYQKRDPILRKISPSAHNAIYDVERFLALMVKENNDSNDRYLKKNETQWPLRNAVTLT